MDFDLVARASGVDGWLELRLSGGSDRPRVLAKFEVREGRGVVTRVIVAGDNLDSATLRALPLGRLESAVNHPDFGFPVTAVEPLDPETLDELASLGHLFPAEFDAINRALDRYLAEAPADRPGGTATRRRERQRLTRPDGTDPDGFSQLVATAYSDAALTSSAPAKLLAEEAGVPVGTVHRWVREARQRGHLPPARKGRAG